MTRWRIASALLIVAVVIASGWLYKTLELTPQVRHDFFFAAEDPVMQQSGQLARRFGSVRQVAITAIAGSIESDAYLHRVTALSDDLLRQPGILSVKSLSEGPGSYAEAVESPLWKPLLITDNGSATHVIVVLSPSRISEAITAVEQVVANHDAEDFRLHIAGSPYVTEMLSRELASDFRRNSVVALAVMVLVVAALFRSVAITAGGLVASVVAVVLTLYVQQRLGIPLGILSANLATIVVVLVISHVVFMSGNWQRLASSSSAGPATDPAMRTLRESWVQTIRASFWCMLTTLLSFATLLRVEAEPLRQLGLGGIIGSLCALGTAFLVFPAFLASAGNRRNRPSGAARGKGSESFWKRPAWGVVAALIVGVAGLGAASPRLDTDPDLFAYFPDDGPVEAGLRYIDRNGGSSPLIFSVRRTDGQRLDNKEGYRLLLALHEALQNVQAVGTVISLPLIMAEAREHPLSFLFSHKRLLNFLQSDRYGRVADNFITADRSSAYFMMRMIEGRRGDATRLEVVEKLRTVASENQFNVELVGGVYYLQGTLARMVESSLWQGLSWMLVVIAFTGLVISRSVRVAVSFVLVIAGIPVAIVGVLAIARIPLDIIAAPAIIVAIGMGVDMAIHLTTAARLSGTTGREAWSRALDRQWRSIAGSAVIVMAGFGVLAQSAFPPTARFGLAVMIGTLAAAALTLWVLPVLATLGGKR
jgi:predicted RND superfamily exporter protein